MNPSSKIFFQFIFFTVFTSKAFCFKTQTISYSDHCNSYASEAIPTTDRVFTRLALLEPETSHYTGGQNIFAHDPPSQRSISFLTTNIFKTNVVDTYKINARLSFIPSNIYLRSPHFTSMFNNSRVGLRNHRTLVFYLDGFWSVSTSKLCMVGFATWFTKEGNQLNLNAVLKLNAALYLTLNNSLVSGTLESLATPHDFDYFDPISMLGFPRAALYRYNYTLVSNEDCIVPKTETVQDSVTTTRSLKTCTIFPKRITTYKLEYPSNCKNCSLLSQDDDGYLHTFMSLYPPQCSQRDKKLRFLVEFQDKRFTPHGQSFRPDITLIGEGTWNGTNDKVCIVACRILNQSDPLGSVRVGDCPIRLTFWFPAVWSITKTHTTEGQIWTTKFTDDLGSFRSAKFQSFDHSRENYRLKYEYTQMEKVRRICPKKKHAGDKYELDFNGFNIFVKHKNMLSSGSAVPLFAGSQDLPLPEDISTINSGLVNISFEISFMLNISSISRSGISSLNLSSTDDDRVEITAEGIYDDETGEICMVGCRNLIKNASFDCEILVKFQLPQSNGNRSLIKGNTESLREKTDALYFENLDIFSHIITKTEARNTIWRMDLEIIMVLISDTLMCVFIGRQLFHLKKRPEMVNFISVLMMLILTLGHMVPLVLNFEVILPNTGDNQNVPIRSNGLLEVNEVIGRIVSMVAFILQFRLLQLTWIAKQSHWIHEIRTLVICLLMYIMGGLAMLLVNWKSNNYSISSQSQRSMWGDMRSYAGLTIDGFLFPQLILNIFQVSKGNALSHSFYVGTTFVRLLPHVYDLYRGQKYISHQFDKLYIYANPRADFYSPCWDIVIVCGGLVFAVIVFLQQRFGGRFMFPKPFQEHSEYEMVPVTNNEQSVT